MHQIKWLIPVILLPAMQGHAQSNGFNRAKAITLKRVVERNHIQPVPVNDEFSKRLFHTFLTGFDEGKLLLLQSDVDQLKKYELLLDDELNGTSPWQFLDAATAVIKKRLAQLPAVIEQAAAKPFVFTQPDQVAIKSAQWAADAPAQLKRLTAWLKWQVLNELLDDAMETEREQGSYKLGTIMAAEPALRKQYKEMMIKQVGGLLSSTPPFEDDMAEDYFTALTACFDPHTSYLSVNQKKRFDDILSDRREIFGFMLAEENGSVVIGKLQPGSPAWNSNQLHKGDVIISIQWNQEAPATVAGMDEDDVEELLGRDEQQLTLTVKKADGTEKKVVLRRQKVVVEEDIVKSFILNGPRKVGYISLPDFYTSWDGEGERGCGADVALELAKLKKENIEGLILDLRYNGGGSMFEAIDLAGLFIDEGPLSMEKSMGVKVRTLKDMNRGSMYDGPLLVLVNGSSASASELVAATLQDLNRAVIAGATTFGKATAQVVLPADTINTYGPGDTRTPGYGYVKVTMGRLYRLTGKTAQQNGVEPDVPLPMLWTGSDREATLPYALAPETVPPNTYYKPLPPLPLARLREASAARTAAGFGAIKQLQPELQALLARESWPLQWNAALAAKQKLAQADESAEAAPAAGPQVTMHQFNRQRWQATPELKAVSDEWIKDIAEDLYIRECYYIVNDLIQKK